MTPIARARGRLKILPDSWLADAERRARFDREARVLASLNHPNIGSIYGVHDSDGVRALVLELVDGETLAERLARRGEARPLGVVCRSTDRDHSAAQILDAPRGGARTWHRSPRPQAGERRSRRRSA